MSTDYVADHGCPEPYLRRIAEAGFSHVHWCHHWSGDFQYGRAEIRQIAQWLKDYGLRLLDLHASKGEEKNWCSERAYERRAGVELVRNRLQMAHALGADVIIMHVPAAPEDESGCAAYWSRLGRSLRELEPTARRLGVRIAIENGHFPTITRLLAEWPADYVGLCYDSGHANCDGDGLAALNALKDRLISIQLHDNDGTGDQHKLLFTGSVDWERLARVIAASAYSKCVSLETLIHNTGYTDEMDFLRRTHEDGLRFARMLAAARGAPPS